MYTLGAAYSTNVAVDALDVLEAEVDWEGADGSCEQVIGPMSVATGRGIR